VFIRILIDSYRFFDRRWQLIVAAALVSLGLIECIVLAVHYAIPDPAVILKDNDGNAVPIGYDDLLESFLMLMSKIWFDGFIAFLLKFELEGIPVQLKHTVLRSIAIYPRILLISLCAQLLIVPSVIAAILIIPSDPSGILSLIPLITAIILFVWFSLVIPVAVIDKTVKVISALRRSRYLVQKYFFMIAAIILLSSLPSLAMIDISDDSLYAHLVAVLLYFATMIMGSLVTLFAYMHLRIVKGEAIVEETRAAADDNSQQ
jgi:hypothetical protein